MTRVILPRPRQVVFKYVHNCESHPTVILISTIRSRLVTNSNKLQEINQVRTRTTWAQKFGSFQNTRLLHTYTPLTRHVKNWESLLS